MLRVGFTVSLLFNACDVTTQLAPDPRLQDGFRLLSSWAPFLHPACEEDDQWPSHGLRTRAAHSPLKKLLLREAESVLLKLSHPAHLKKEVDHSSRLFLLRDRLRPARARVALAGRGSPLPSSVPYSHRFFKCSIQPSSLSGVSCSTGTWASDRHAFIISLPLQVSRITDVFRLVWFAVGLRFFVKLTPASTVDPRHQADAEENLLFQVVNPLSVLFHLHRATFTRRLSLLTAMVEEPTPH